MASFGKAKYRILIVSQTDKIPDSIEEILPSTEYERVLRARDGGEAKRMLLSQQVDVVIINTPLKDDFGIDTALDLAENPIGIMLLVKNEIFNQVSYQVEDSGVATLGKPLSRHEVYSAVKILTALSARLAKMEKKNRSLQEKMGDIRVVNRAKWLLIENMKMSENDAHSYIEHEAMDRRISRREMAEKIIATYDNTVH